MADDRPFDRDLLDVLVCPLARRPLMFVEGRLVSTDPDTRRAYPVQDGIPDHAAIDRGEELEVEEWQRLMDAGGLVEAARGFAADAAGVTPAPAVACTLPRGIGPGSPIDRRRRPSVPNLASV